MKGVFFVPFFYFFLSLISPVTIFSVTNVNTIMLFTSRSFKKKFKIVGVSIILSFQYYLIHRYRFTYGFLVNSHNIHNHTNFNLIKHSFFFSSLSLSLSVFLFFSICLFIYFVCFHRSSETALNTSNQLHYPGVCKLIRLVYININLQHIVECTKNHCKISF